MFHKAKTFIFIFFFMTGCSAAPPVREKEMSIPAKEEQVTEVNQELEEDTRNGLRASLIKDGILKSSPHVLADELKMIPQYAEVSVSGYEESTNLDGYLRINYDNDSGYLSTDYVFIDNSLKEFIESERQKIYTHNLQTLKIIEENQQEIESREAWVKSITANIRVSPSTDSTIIDNLERGSIVFIQEEREGWYRILYNGPIFDFGSSDYEDIAYIVNSYEDPSDLVSAYREGWVQEGFVSDITIEKLSAGERRRLVYVNEHPDLLPIIKDAILNGEIIIGMSRDMVIASWGNADEVNRSRSAFDIHEEWIYGDTYLYFENGILNAWQNFDE